MGDDGASVPLDSFTSDPEGSVNEHEERPRWARRISFLFAAIGSAVGLGNIWRFPYLCNKFGGGAFLIPYFLCLILVGHPVLLLELSLGQKFQSGDVDAFGSINRRFRGVGIASVFGAYIIVWYYCVVIAWACLYFAASFQKTLPFAGTTTSTEMIGIAMTCNVTTSLTYPLSVAALKSFQFTKINQCSWPKKLLDYHKIKLPQVKTKEIRALKNLTLDKMYCAQAAKPFLDNSIILNSVAQEGKKTTYVENIKCKPKYSKTSKDANAEIFFYNKVLRITSGIDDSNNEFNDNLVLALILVYLMQFAAVFKGVKSASCVVLFTMPVPFILLIALFFQGLTLPGASYGIKQYLKWDDSLMGDASLWSSAIGQSFFSLGVCMGIMTAYSSYNPPDQNVVADNHIIAFADTITSFFGGFVVYSVLGFLHHETGDDSVFTKGGPGLTFVTYPQALAEMSGGHAWGAIFFLCLVLLGIDSAFSLVEAFSTVITDRIGHQHQTLIILIICICGLLMGLRFAVDSGLYWLDLIDFYVNSFGMVFVGMMECVVVGWFYEKDNHRKEVGPALDFFRWSTFIIVVLATAVGLGAAEPVETASGIVFEGGVGGTSAVFAFFGGFGLWLFTILICVIKVYNFRDCERAKGIDLPKWSVTTVLWEVCGWHGPEMLRDRVNPEGPCWFDLDSAGKCKRLFDFHRVGTWWGFLIKFFIPPVLFLILCSTIRKNWYTPYGGYGPRYQAVGLLICFIMLMMIVLPMLEPDLVRNRAKESEPVRKPRANTASAGVEGAQVTEDAILLETKEDTGTTDEDIAKEKGA